jgi:hypothetical protein
MSYSVDVNAAVDQLSKLLLDQYVETDPEIGPRISRFEQAEAQLQVIGTQVTSLRDASTSQHEAHLELSKLVLAAAATGAAPTSVCAFSERQEGLARLTQHLATHYNRFVSISVNQLEGLSLVVANKYKAYCNKVVEMRRRKAQLQLLQRQKECSDLRTLERSLIPKTPQSGFTTDLEGALLRQSSTTRLWWSTYARLDAKRMCLLFTSRQSEPPSAAAKAVALSRYALCHELPERHARRPAAFELVPTSPDLPVVVLAADGTMASRRWICALQQAIDGASVAASQGTASQQAQASDASAAAGPGTDAVPSAVPSGVPSADEAGAGAEDESASPGMTTPPPMPASSRSAASSTTADSSSAVPAPFLPIVSKLGEVLEFGSSKIDELDRQLAGTLAEQSQRTEVQLAQLEDERASAAQGVVTALDEFADAMDTQMAEELLRISEAELEYHKAMAAHLAGLVATLRAGASDRGSSATSAATSAAIGNSGSHSPQPGRTHTDPSAAAPADSFGAASSGLRAAAASAIATASALATATSSAGGGGSTSAPAAPSLPLAATPTTPTIEASLAPIEVSDGDVTWASADRMAAAEDDETQTEVAAHAAAQAMPMPGGSAEEEDDEIVD